MKSLKVNIILVILLVVCNYSIAQIDSLIKYFQDDEYIITIQTKKEYLHERRNSFISDSYILEFYHKSPHYFYKLLDSIATDDKLLELLAHESPIIQAYAAEAIAHRDTMLLPLVLKKMLDNYSRVAVRGGSVVLSWTTALRVYAGLRDRRSETGLPTQTFIDKLDSIYISHRNTPSLDIGVKLHELRSKSLNSVIENIVIERKDIYATDYLYKWYKGDYYELLNRTYIAILDSCSFDWRTPNVKDIISKIIELNDTETLKILGSWLNNNRDKWVGIKNIDKALDRSYLIQDSIGWTNDRYPFDNVDVDYLLGDWNIVSGMKIYKHNEDIKDTIVIEQADSSHTPTEVISVDFSNSNNALVIWGEGEDGRKSNMAFWPAYDSLNKRICLSTSDWLWYKVVKEEDKIILIKE